jgi:hypothetical protein
MIVQGMGRVWELQGVLREGERAPPPPLDTLIHVDKSLDTLILGRFVWFF